MLGRICQTLSLLVIILAVPRGAAAQSSDANASPVNAAAIVVGEHKGQEVARWAGALAWQGRMPAELVAHEENNRWTWQPHTQRCQVRGKP
jgi:hypothetical protein